jgi:hypothetical protein
MFEITDHGKTYSGVVWIDDRSVRIELCHDGVFVPIVDLTITGEPSRCPRVVVRDEWGDLQATVRLLGI